MFFLTQVTQKGHFNCLKPTGIELKADPMKIYHVVYICEKERCGTITE